MYLVQQKAVRFGKSLKLSDQMMLFKIFRQCCIKDQRGEFDDFAKKSLFTSPRLIDQYPFTRVMFLGRYLWGKTHRFLTVAFVV